MLSVVIDSDFRGVWRDLRERKVAVEEGFYNCVSVERSRKKGVVRDEV